MPNWSPPDISATTAPTNASGSVIRIPSATWSNALGRYIENQRRQEGASIALAKSQRPIGTFCKPAQVLRIIGKKHAVSTSANFETQPASRYNTMIGVSATIG